MNKTKRFCAIALAAMMAASALAACGGNTESSTAPAPAASTPADDGGAGDAGDAGSTGDVTAAPTDAIDLGGEDDVTLKVWGPDAAQTVLRKQCDDFIAAVADQATVTIEVVPMGEDVAATQALTDATAAAEITVENNAGSELPSTGGIGTTLFYVVGSVLVIGAAVVLISKRRMAR